MRRCVVMLSIVVLSAVQWVLTWICITSSFYNAQDVDSNAGCTNLRFTLLIASDFGTTNFIRWLWKTNGLKMTMHTISWLWCMVWHHKPQITSLKIQPDKYYKASIITMEPGQTQEVIKCNWTKFLPWGVCFHLFCHKTVWTIFWRVIVATKMDTTCCKFCLKRDCSAGDFDKRFSAKSMSWYTRWL